MRHAFAALITAVAVLSLRAADSPKIYWGDEVPKGWNGAWPEELRTVPERTGFTRTTSTLQLHEFIAALKPKSEHGTTRAHDDQRLALRR